MSALAVSLDALATQANAAHLEAERLAVGALAKARESGEALRAAKEQIPHGEFGGWLHENFSGSARTAQIYMRVARRWPEVEAKAQRAADLSMRQATALLRPPPETSQPGRLDELEDIIECGRQAHGDEWLQRIITLVMDEEGTS